MTMLLAISPIMALVLVLKLSKEIFFCFSFFLSGVGFLIHIYVVFFGLINPELL